ncbi:MAG: glycosyltransferase, partial [Stellaceae bacterium]
AYTAFLRRPGVRMLSNSKFGARDYEDWLGVGRGAVQVIYNWCEFAGLRARTSPQAAAGARAEAGIPPEAIVVGGVMRCSFEKRPELWTEIACELAGRDPRVYGILVGDGPMRPRLIRHVEQLGFADRIRFVGRRSPVEPWMQAMDLLFLSSMTEGLPNVLIEAQSLGLAVATMRVGGAPETVLEGRSAVIIDEAPAARIADAIGTLLFDRARLRAYGKTGAGWASRMFSVEAMLDRLLMLYGEDAGEGGKRGAAVPRMRLDGIAAAVTPTDQRWRPATSRFRHWTRIVRPSAAQRDGVRGGDVQ